MPTDATPNADLPPPADELDTLRAIVKGTAGASGPEFFHALVRHLAFATGTRFAFVAEFLGDHRARTLAFWSRDHVAENVEWDLRGTPCHDVVRGALCHHPTGVRVKFPDDEPLVRLGIESYLGVPLRDGGGAAAGGAVLGHLAVFDDRAMPPEPRREFIFRIFAERATAELLRLRAEAGLKQSEERFRDLFDEAPIAYVLEGLDSRFIRANRTAMRSLGISPDEVAGAYGRDFVPDTPEAKQRLREAFESVGRGTDTSGVVLELRRRDDGKPLWIQWWSRPDPGGTYTRTMFLDITERVLMEREQVRLRAQNRLLREELDAATNFAEIVGTSAALRAVTDNVRRVAPTDSTVLIQGETGTGKELVARAVHDHSQRKAAAFVKVNCAALPAGLVESEFFGHEKGAFTGAVSARRGRFELADGGTIFLDEVGEVSPEVQVKLLRVLQESEFERVGGSQTIRVNVRVIAATNRDLAADVAAGRFRADLFYRLSVFPISVPPLRARATDIPLLANYFVAQLATAMGKRFDSVEPESMDRLVAYAWPGNIRELRNILERAVILCPGPVLRIGLDDLTPHASANAARGLGTGLATGPATGAATDPTAETIDDLERRHIRAVLGRTGGIIAGPNGAAKILGVPPSTLRSIIERLGIQG